MLLDLVTLSPVAFIGGMDKQPFLMLVADGTVLGARSAGTWEGWGSSKLCGNAKQRCDQTVRIQTIETAKTCCARVDTGRLNRRSICGEESTLACLGFSFQRLIGSAPKQRHELQACRCLRLKRQQEDGGPQASTTDQATDGQTWSS